MKKLLVILAVFISQTITAQLDPGIILADPTKVNTLEENAIVHYTRQIEANPDDVHAIMLRSELHRALGQTAKWTWYCQPWCTTTTTTHNTCSTA